MVRWGMSRVAEYCVVMLIFLPRVYVTEVQMLLPVEWSSCRMVTRLRLKKQ